ncbi:MAG: hypothetical protein K2F88_06630 [Duncaniella sp.]|nr:hypothetical protein [Duncaniella sp.]
MIHRLSEPLQTRLCPNAFNASKTYATANDHRLSEPLPGRTADTKPYVAADDSSPSYR